MIQLSGLTKSFGDRVLFGAVTWQVDDRERVGLCGPNGAGKTTLLRMLAGIDEPDAGDIIKPAGLTIGYLPQDGLEHQGRTVFGEASLAFAPLLAMKEEMHSLEERMGAPEATEDDQAQMLDRYSELSDRFRLAEGYSIDLQVATVLTGLGFSRADFDRPADTFSGGWQMRIALAKLLLGRPGLLLLDEPTNHLDLEARNWLESYLREYPHAVMLVSHDRFFLDSVVTRIADLNLRTLTDYHGNYSDYLVERDARIERLRAAKREQDEEVARVKLFVDRFRYQATKAAQVQSRIKMLEKVVPIEVPPERKKVHFTFPAAPKGGRTVLELKHVRKAYGPLVVFEDLSLHIERGDRIALVGPNGTGQVHADAHAVGVGIAGSRRAASGPPGGRRVLRAGRGHAARSGEDGLRDARLRLADAHGPRHPEHPRRVPLLGRRHLQEVRRALGRRAHAPGRRTHAAATVEPAAAGRADEPPGSRLEGRAAGRAGGLRRHADLRVARPILRRAPRDADHRDRRRPGRVVPRHVPGVPLAEGAFARKCTGARARENRVRPAAEPRVAKTAHRPAQEKGPRAAAKVDHEQRKREQAEQRKLDREKKQRQARVADLETRIAAHEESIRTLESRMSAPGFYDDRDAAQQAVSRHQTLMWEVGELMHQWEMLAGLAERPGGDDE
jgi:ATP-binding cassette subfamily F protein 3